MHTNEFNTLKTFNAGVRHISVTTKASPFDGEQNAVVRFTVDTLSKLLPYTSVYQSNETSSHSFLLNAYLGMS